MISRSAWVALLATSLASAPTIGFVEAKGADEAGPCGIPAPFAPLEYLIGRWHGQGIPKDNPAKQFRGWTERHTWAWFFAHGKPAGLTLTIEGGKVLASGKLTYDPARRVYRLDGREPKPLAGPLSFEGALDKTGKYLELDHVAANTKSARPSGTLRLSIWPNANFIRYSMAHDLRDAGAVQFTRLIEVGLTRDGESLAAGATAAEQAKCIVTGGAANMTFSYQGRTFPICCTGCRDEFNENPEKYIKKASLLLDAQAARAKSSPPAPARRLEDAFAKDVTDPSSTEKQPPASSNKSAAKPESTADPSPAESNNTSPRASSKKDGEKSPAAKAASRAASLLKLGQNLDKSGKTTAALSYYRRVVKEYPETPAAKTAAARIKALDKP
jgi:YHS domain-containing protein